MWKSPILGLEGEKTWLGKLKKQLYLKKKQQYPLTTLFSF